MTNNLTSAQTYAREGGELGSLPHRQARIEAEEWQRRITQLSLGYAELKAAGMASEAQAVKQYGAELISQRWGL